MYIYSDVSLCDWFHMAHVSFIQLGPISVLLNSQSRVVVVWAPRRNKLWQVKDQMHSSSIPAGDLEKQQQDKSPEKQSESISESANEVNLTIVVCNGDSSQAHETVAAESEEPPKKVCLSRNGSSHDQCRSAPSLSLSWRFQECEYRLTSSYWIRLICSLFFFFFCWWVGFACKRKKRLWLI